MPFKNSLQFPDIETALQFDTFENPFPPEDTRYFRETLFYTQSGFWYLFFHVTPISNHNQLCFDFFAPLLKIRALTRDQTFNWLLIHSTVDKIREFFIMDPKNIELSL